MVGQLWQRGVLRRAAQRYANRGWRVVPGAFLIGDRYVCGPVCLTVSCHPAVDHWENAASADMSDVDGWRARPRTPHGRIRWERSPAASDWRLPDPYRTQQALLGDEVELAAAA